MKKVKEIVKILHIDRNWKITYVIIRKGILMKSRVSLEATLAMVKKDLFDLILSEPQNLAILKAWNRNDKNGWQHSPNRLPSSHVRWSIHPSLLLFLLYLAGDQSAQGLISTISKFKSREQTWSSRLFFCSKKGSQGMNIVLIGGRCSGKTTVGRLLADRTGRAFQDTDTLVEKMAGASIEELVAARGWSGFRALEKQAVATVAEKDRQVIATGGGAVLDRDNVRNLAKQGFLVWLDGRPEVLAGRLAAQQQTGEIRPSLTGADPVAEIGQIMKTRRKVYEEISALRVDTSNLSAVEVAEGIMEDLMQKEG
jgi:shikimate kinase